LQLYGSEHGDLHILTATHDITQTGKSKLGYVHVMFYICHKVLPESTMENLKSLVE